MSTEIKNTLFRFVTMRAPEAVSDENLVTNFVNHPDLVNGEIPSSDCWFKNSLTNPKESVVEQMADMQTLATALSEDSSFIDDIYELQVITGNDHWVFSNAFSRLKKASLKQSSAADLLGTYPGDPLSAAVLIQLWDNLFYQILKPKNAKLRDAIMHVLIANHQLSTTAFN